MPQIVKQSFALHLYGLSFSSTETVLLVVALVFALLLLVELVRLFGRDGLRRRVAELQRTSEVVSRPSRMPWYGRLGTIVAMSPLVGKAERRRLDLKLASAGVHGSARVATFIGFKTCTLMLVASAAWGYLDWSGLLGGHPVAGVFAILVAILLGWRLPDVALTRISARRRLRLELSIPDALDLLVICAEAGLGLEQAINHVAHDLRLSAPDVAAEFATTASEIRVMDRRVALENLAERTGLKSLRGLISTLNQSARFGTPLSESLRILAAEMRVVRIARLEERAARLSVTLMLPLMGFILPCLLLVIGGPIVLRTIDALRHTFNH